MQLRFYAGTYLSLNSTGIYQFFLDMDTGALSDGMLAISMPDAKHLAGNGDVLASTYRNESAAGVCLMKEKNGTLQVTATETQGKVAPCYVTFLGDYLVTANYHEGTVHVYHHRNGTLELGHRLDLGIGAGCHQALLCMDWLLVPCLEHDRIYLFDWLHGCTPVGEIIFPAGSGPRHGVFSPDKKRLWVVGERDNHLYCFQLSPHGFVLEDRQNILPATAPKESLSAAIRLSPDNRYLTVSSRGANVLTTWHITENGLRQVQQLSCGGDHPRDFIFTPDGRYLLCANRETGEIVSFARDAQSGKIDTIIDQIKIAQAVSLVY